MNNSPLPPHDLAAQIVAQWVNGQPPNAKQALAQHPELARDKAIVLDLAYAEYCLRTERGEELDHEVFCAQFPSHRVSLARLLAQHALRQEALAADSPSSVAPATAVPDPLATNPLAHEGIAAQTQNVEIVPLHGSDPNIAPLLPISKTDLPSGTPATTPSGPSSQPRYGPQEWPANGAKVGDFNLIRQMGKGAFGRVFLAFEEPTDRHVVVKISKQRCDEAKVLGKLLHHNVVSVLSAPHDQATGLYIIAMPYHGSATLEDLLELAYPLTPTHLVTKRADIILTAARRNHHQTDPKPEEFRPDPFLSRAGFIDGVIWLGVRLAEALEAVHRSGFVHHDLKPSNVLLGLDGQPRLLDFNLATDIKNTKSRLGGTLPYMPPEHLKVLEHVKLNESTPSAMNAQGDIFSFGVILYELLTGTHPYGRFPKSRSVRKVASEILGRQKLGVKPIRERNPEVPARLAKLVNQCLAFEPGERPTSAAAIADELRKCYSLKKRAFAFAGSGTGRSLMMIAAIGTVSAAYFFAPAQATPMPIDPPAPDYHALAQKAVSENRHEEAIHYLLKLIQEEPSNAEHELTLGREYITLTDWRQARAHLERASDLRPTHGETLALLGWTYAKQGFSSEALETLNKATRNGVNNSAIHAVKSFCYAQLRRDDLAIEEANQALRLDPNNRVALTNRAYVTFVKSINAKKLPETIFVDIERALVVGPNEAHLSLWAARTYAFALTKLGHIKGPYTPEMVEYKARSLACLQKAVEAGLSPTLWKTDSTFTLLHGPAEVISKDWMRPNRPLDLLTDWRIGNPNDLMAVR